MKSNPRKIILAGGSGFLGQCLAADLCTDGWDVVVLTRRPESYRGAGRAIYWNGSDPGKWSAELDGADALVNLTGKNVNCRPTRSNRQEILTSRVNSVRVLGEALRTIEAPPPVWIQTSSLAIYGDARDRICDEAAHVAEGFPANVCTAWEEALGEALLPEIRWVTLRIGFVVGREGGALPFLARLAKFGLGGSIGNGKQWISWIHLDDMIAMFREAIENPEWSGVYNATGPDPVTNADFMHELRRTLNRPWSPPVPAPAVWLGAWLLGSDPKIALTGRRCVPARLKQSGFDFQHTQLSGALADLYPENPKLNQPQPLRTHEIRH